MLKRDELRDQKSCLNKARSDEQIFVLRANDRIAAQTVRHWATMAEGMHETEKIGEALAWADAVDKFHASKPMPALQQDVEKTGLKVGR